MTTANYNRNDIENILSQARIYNPQIGNYVRHMVDANDFNYPVKLDNGSIKILWDELQDQNYLTPERLKVISTRFISDKPNIVSNTLQEKIETYKPIKNKSWFRKLLEKITK